MQSTNMLVISAITLLFTVECLTYTDRYRRQTSNDEDPECQLTSSSEEGTPKLLPECCQVPDLIARENTHCKSLLFKQNTTESGLISFGPEEEFSCFFECVFNRSRYITKDNKINKELLRRIMENAQVNFTEADYTAAFKGAVANCFDNSVYLEEDAHKCKSGALELLHCFSRHLFLNCPSRVWTSSNECTQIKAKIEKCPGMPTPRFFDKRTYFKSE